MPSSGGTMTGATPDVFEIDKKRRVRRKRRCCIASASALLVILTLAVIILILAFTVFKRRDPETQVLSTKIDGIAPRVSFPALKIELNVTLDLEILVKNRNHASFKHGQGESLVFYKENQVGQVDISPGTIPSMGDETIQCRLTVEADKLGSDMSELVGDVVAGMMVFETRTRIPGRVTILGFVKRHAVAVSNCRLEVGVPDMKVRKQECRNKTKL